MQEQKFKAKEKKVNRMTRSGLVEENLATKGSRKLTDKQEELSLKKSYCESNIFTSSSGLYGLCGLVSFFLVFLRLGKSSIKSSV